MKKILMFDTSYGSQNMGDYIINESINREMSGLLDGNFVVRYSTHTPIQKTIQNIHLNPISRYCRSADYKFLCGTNIFKTNLFKLSSDFNIGMFDIANYKNCIAIGCGSTVGSSNKINWYTRCIYKGILSKQYIHSARDERTKEMLEGLGLKALNTGCATMWMLTKSHCKKIPKAKADNVVFTLTDYSMDKENDQLLINILNKKYKNVYFWVQGSNDYEYFKTLKNTETIQVVSPSLMSFEKILRAGNIDYIGTRLHAGIYSMQHLVRSIILAVDNRTRDIKHTYNIPTIERAVIGSELEKVIDSSFSTDIKINEKNIATWKKQFIENHE